jgi:proline iminopeptidase
MNCISRVLLAISLLVGLAAAASPVAKEGFVEVEGGPVWYRVFGSSAGNGAAPVLFIHGGPGGSSCKFEPVALLLSRFRQVVIYDQLGSGRSGRPMDANLWTVDRFASEIVTLRKALGLKEIHLVGHSWGAALAAQYVIGSRPSGIKSVVFSGPLLSTEKWIADANVLRTQLPEKTQEILTRNEQAGTVHSEEYVAATDEFYNKFLFHQEVHPVVASCAQAPFNQEIYELMWGPTEFHATGSLRTFDVTPRLRDIHAPLLFTAGRYDEARPDTVKAFARLVPGSRVEILENSGHMAPVEEPERYAAILEQFFETSEQAARKRTSHLQPVSRARDDGIERGHEEHAD